MFRETTVTAIATKPPQAPKYWQNGVISAIHAQVDRSECTNFMGISLLSLPGKVYVMCLETGCHEIIVPKLNRYPVWFSPWT